jgi:hypothetical protein
MNNTYKSQIATLEDDNAENEKMPQNSKIWIPPAKVRFLEKKGDFWRRGMWSIFFNSDCMDRMYMQYRV